MVPIMEGYVLGASFYVCTVEQPSNLLCIQGRFLEGDINVKGVTVGTISKYIAVYLERVHRPKQ